MASFNKFNCFVEDMAKAKHKLDVAGGSTQGDELRVALFADAPQATDAVFSDLSGELGAANGYSAGGTACTVSASSQTGGTYKLVIHPDPVFTASGGDLGGSGDVFRYVVLYNYTDSTKPLIGYYDYGSNVTISDGNTFTVDFHQTNGVFTNT